VRYSGRFGKVSAQELDVTAVVPDSVDRAVDGADARTIGERAIKFTHGKVRGSLGGWLERCSP